jgi:hypothetical protein
MVEDECEKLLESFACLTETRALITLLANERPVPEEEGKDLPF